MVAASMVLGCYDKVRDTSVARQGIERSGGGLFSVDTLSIVRGYERIL